MVRVYIHSCENLEATCRRYRDESVPRLRTQGLRDPRFLSCDVREYLNNVYGDPWISHGEPVTSCDFYLGAKSSAVCTWTNHKMYRILKTRL